MISINPSGYNRLSKGNNNIINRKAINHNIFKIKNNKEEFRKKQ